MTTGQVGVRLKKLVGGYDKHLKTIQFDVTQVKTAVEVARIKHVPYRSALRVAGIIHVCELVTMLSEKRRDLLKRKVKVC